MWNFVGSVPEIVGQKPDGWIIAWSYFAVQRRLMTPQNRPAALSSKFFGLLLEEDKFQNISKYDTCTLLVRYCAFEEKRSNKEMK